MTDSILPPLELLGQRMLPKEHVPSMTGAVAIDIDEFTGALVVVGESDHVGKECFVTGPDDFHKHVWFLDRVLPGRTQVAAVFACLNPGSYDIDIEGEQFLGSVTIVAGEICTIVVDSSGVRPTSLTDAAG